MKIDRIRLDIDKKLAGVIPSVQWDNNTRYLHINVLNGTEAFNLSGYSVKVAGLKPDGTNFFNDVRVINAREGFIEVVLTEQMNAAAGSVRCELKLYNHQGVLSTQPFIIYVETSVTPKDIISSNEFKALTDALSKVNNIDTKFENLTSETVKAATEKEIQNQIANGNMANLAIAPGSITQDKLSPDIKFGIEDGKVTPEKLSNEILKFSKYSPNLFDVLEAVDNKTIDVYTVGNKGNLTDAIGSCVSGYIYVESDTKYTRNKNSFTTDFSDPGRGYNQTVFYDKDKKYISHLRHHWGMPTFTTPANCKYIRIILPLANKKLTTVALGENQLEEPTPYYKEYELGEHIKLTNNNLVGNFIEEKHISTDFINAIASKKYLNDGLPLLVSYQECDYNKLNGARLEQNNCVKHPIKNFKIIPNESNTIVESVRICGKNIFDGKLEIGTINNSGFLVNNPNHQRPVNFTPVEPKTDYAFNFLSKNGYLLLTFYDKNKKFLSYMGVNVIATITTPTDAYFMKFRYESLNPLSFQMEKGKKQSDFENYEGYNIVFDDIVLSRNGDAYDELDIVKQTLIKRIDNDGTTILNTPKVIDMSSKMSSGSLYPISLDGYMYVTVENKENSGLPNIEVSIPIEKTSTVKELNSNYLYSKTYKDIVSMNYYRDVASATSVTMIIIESKDFNKVKIKPTVRLTGANISDRNFTSTEVYAEKNNHLACINAGIFAIDTTGLSDGIVISEGDILQDTPQTTHRGQYCLGIKKDGTMKSYPPEVSAAEIKADGCDNAVVGFVPIIDNYLPVSQSILSICPHAFEKHPRQIIGQLRNGDYIVMTCEGRIEGESGMTLNECITFLQQFNLRFAYNLDGGGSTETVVGKKQINRYFGGEATQGRKVPNVIAFDIS